MKTNENFKVFLVTYLKTVSYTNSLIFLSDKLSVDALKLL